MVPILKKVLKQAQTHICLWEHFEKSKRMINHAPYSKVEGYMMESMVHGCQAYISICKATLRALLPYQSKKATLMICTLSQLRKRVRLLAIFHAQDLLFESCFWVNGTPSCKVTSRKQMSMPQDRN